MAFNLETFMESLPENARSLLHEQMKHPVSWFAPEGKHLANPYEQENLLKVLMGMERYVVDSNSPWKREAGKAVNFDKAFIVGETVADEPDNLKGVLFSQHIDISNNNLFTFGMNKLGIAPFYEIGRFDEHHRSIFDEKSLDEESKPRVGRTDAESLKREREHMFGVNHLRQFILHGLELADLDRLPAPAITEPKKTRLLRMILELAPNCLGSHWNSIRVATFCYAVLLLERDEIGSKTRREFNDPNNRNVFGDCRLLQNSLWLSARMFSSDKAVKRMAQYINLPEITVTDRIANPLARILWFRFLTLGRRAKRRLKFSGRFRGSIVAPYPIPS